MSYSCAFCRRSERSLGAGLLSVFILLASTTLSGQAPKPTDLEYHKFRPKVAPEPMASSALNQATISNGISASVLQQMQALQLEKMSRTPAQQKIDSNVLYTVRMLAGKDAAPGVTSLYTGVDLDASDNLIVDMVANVTDALLSQLNSAGAQVLYTNRALRSIRASIPPQTIENIAASPDVVFISPRQGSSTRQELSGHIRPISGQNTAPTFRKRAEKIRQQLSAVASVAGTVQMGQGSVETEGDITHRTMVAREASAWMGLR